MAAEAAAGHVVLGAGFRGMRSSISRPASSVVGRAASGATAGLAGVGRSTGAKLGRGVVGALSVPAVSGRALQVFQGDVARTSRALSTARLRHSDSAGRVRVAEARKAEAIARSGAGSVASLAADERLASARRRLTVSADAVTVASTNLQAAQRKLSEVMSATSASSARAASGIGGAFSRAGAGASNAGSSILRAVGGGLSRAGDVARDTSRLIRNQIVAAGAVLVAAVGASLFAGFGRLSAIETAQAKLRALGHAAATVQTITTNALDAVRGTAYGLDEAATIAASAVAAGIKPGQELERYLRLTADAAAIANVPLGEMGSILNKVTTNGRAYTTELNQLADRGIPIYQWLADELGVTQDALRDMVAAGEVDAATYRAAIEKNIGGAALSAGATTQGALKNMRAAFSRFGAGLLGPIFPLFQKLFSTVTAGVDALSRFVAPYAKAIGEQVVAGVAPVLDRLRALFESITAGDRIPMGPLAALATILGGAAAWIERMLSGLLTTGGLPTFAGSLLAGIIDALGAGIPNLVTVFVGLLTSLLDASTAIIPIVASTLAGLLPDVAGLLIVAIPSIITAGLTLLLGLVDALTTLIPAILIAVTALLPLLVATLVTLLPALISGALTLFTGLLQGIVQTIPDLIAALIGLLPVLLEVLLGMLPALIEGAISLFLGLVLGFVDVLPRVLEALVGMLPQVLTSLVDALPQLIVAAITLFVGLIDGLLTAIPTVIRALLDLLPEIITTLVGLGPLLVDAATTLLLALVDGVLSMVSGVGEAIAMLVDLILGFFPRSPAKRGPFSGAGWTRVASAGRAIAEEFAEGVEPTRSTRAVSSILNRVQHRLTEVDTTVMANVPALTTDHITEAFRPSIAKLVDADGQIIARLPVTDAYVQDPFTGEYWPAKTFTSDPTR